LNSGDSFTIFAPDSKAAYIWQGEGSNDKEIEMAKQMLDFFSHDWSNAGEKQDFKEGSESEEFWATVGGKQDYVKVKDHGIVNSDFESSLFWVSNSSGYTYMKAVPAFNQQSLMTEDVYILDCYHEIFVWVGATSNKFEKRGAYSNAAKYIEALKDGRNKDNISMIEVNPTQEPPLFKVQFPVWDNNYSQKWIDTEPFKQLKEHNKTVV